MVKRYTKHPVGAHYGIGDWLLQRLTAVVLALYTIYVAGSVFTGGFASHEALRESLAGGPMRVFTLLFFAALLYHAWVGMRDILMDYVKPAGARLALQSLVALALLGYLAWSATLLFAVRT